MAWRYRVTMLAAAALLIGACGDDGSGKSDLDEAMATLDPGDLGGLVLPIDQLTTLGGGPTFAREGGEKDNAAAAGDSVNPEDTERSLAMAGRLGGYAVDYINEEAAEPGDTFLIASAVELFRDAGAASEAMGKVAEDFRQAEGRERDGQVIGGVVPFDADVGDEAQGLVLELEVPGVGNARGTAIYGRMDRLGFRVAMLSIGEEGREDQVRALADSQARWITDVLAGTASVAQMTLATEEPSPEDEADEEPPRPIPPLEELALRLEELPPGFEETTAAYAEEDGAGERDYTRAFQAEGDYVLLGESRVITLENNIIVFGEDGEAEAFMGAVTGLLAGDQGADFLRTLIEEGGVEVEDLAMDRHESDLGDETVVVEARATTQAGEVVLVFIISREGRALSVFTVTGDATTFHLEDIEPLAEAVVERVRDARLG